MAWIKVSKTEELPLGTMRRVMVEEDDIALYHTEEGFFATSDVCTHASESLSLGRLDGKVVACPKHGGKFDVTTGQPVAFPCVIPLMTYSLDIRGDEIWIDYE